MCDWGARAAHGASLIFARGAAPVRRLPLAAFATALADPRVGVAGLDLAWRNISERHLPSGGARYRFSTVPFDDALFGLRAAVYWELGGLAAGERDAAALALQYRAIRANYRLARLGATRPTTGARPPQRDAERAARKRWKPRFARHRYPELSVAIATRNYGRWLPRCLDSVLGARNPTAAPLQIVVTDDCSTDDTPAILEDYRRRHPRVLTPRFPPTTRGVPTTKNDTIRRCIGRWVALLDADDEFTPDKLTGGYAALRARPRPALVTHDFTFVEDDTGRTEVTGPDWCGGWRPPGAWMFRQDLVVFNEQMVCGYEELEWSKRLWPRVSRVHVAAPLAGVHGTSVMDQWKLDRMTAGAQSMTRWDARESPRRARALACRVCGNQYLRAVACCGRDTEAVPLVPYMVVASGPRATAVELSVVVFVGDQPTRVRRAVDALQAESGAGIEWIFVHCHARAGLLEYLRRLSRTVQLSAVFSPDGRPLVYSHDANRAVRAAAGRYVVAISGDLPVPARDLVAGVRAALDQRRIGMLTARRAGGTATAWAMRREVFWDLGGMAERVREAQPAVRELERRATAAHYLTAAWAGAAGLPARVSRRPLLSVAMVARNAASDLQRSLEPLLTTRARRAHVVVVDECSTDGTRLFLAQCRRPFSSVLTSLRTERVQGAAAAWNLATARCPGRYVAWVEPGDRLSARTLRACVRALERRGADLLILERPGASAWVFRSGTVRLDEQVIAGDPRAEWLARCGARVRMLADGPLARRPAGSSWPV